MKSKRTLLAPYGHLGEGGDYPIEMNYAIRIYDNKGEVIPDVGKLSASLKGGQRTNYHGLVPLLDGNKKDVGVAEIVEIISARPKYMNSNHLERCGFKGLTDAVDYVKREHGKEFERDGVLTIFYFIVLERYEPRDL